MLKIVGLTHEDVRNKPQFNVIGQQLNDWFAQLLQHRSSGVLVSHNTATDIQFLCCEYQRVGLRLPPKVRLGLDTLTTLKRFSSLVYRKVPPFEWPELTKAGKLSMGVKPCATYALSKRDPPEKFETACGEHHDCDADTRAVKIILFDQSEFPTTGLHHCVFNSNKKCLFPLSDVWEAMEIKMKDPVLKFCLPPTGWVSAPALDDEDPLSSSSFELPAGVSEVKEKTFCPPVSQRGEGKPSAKLKQHMGLGTSRSGSVMDAVKMMVLLFLFFFTLPTLNRIASYTNAKALETVFKTEHRRSDGTIYYKVRDTNAYIFTPTAHSTDTCLTSYR